MHVDLERVIELQRLDSAAADAQRRLAEEPERQKALDERLEVGRQAVASARDRLAAGQSARRRIEKDVALHQSRLSKFRDQAMAVKTNQEYHAIQHEVAFAETEIRKLEDQILECMIESDDRTSALKRAEADLAAEVKAVEADRQALAAERVEMTRALERLAADRASLVAALSPGVLATFDLVARRRNGVAVAEAREGVCTICHVRLRPQVFNTIRRNDEIIQCDSCQRILYFAAPPRQNAAGVEQTLDSGA